MGRQNRAVMEKCPTGVIVYRGKSAPDPRQPGRKSAEQVVRT